MSRNDAYILLQKLNGGKRVHMGKMSKLECVEMFNKLYAHYEQKIPELIHD
jgi:hypothetical protein